MKKLTKENVPTLKWAAVDSDGRAFAFLAKPRLGDKIWLSLKDEPPYDTNVCLYIGEGYDSSDWQNSLIKIKDNEKAK
jgi:hypothetical protein